MEVAKYKAESHETSKWAEIVDISLHNASRHQTGTTQNKRT
jgi:hypothetical protein